MLLDKSLFFPIPLDSLDSSNQAPAFYATHIGRTNPIPQYTRGAKDEPAVNLRTWREKRGKEQRGADRDKGPRYESREIYIEREKELEKKDSKDSSLLVDR